MLLPPKPRSFQQLMSPTLPPCTEPMSAADVGDACGKMSDPKIPNSRDVPFPPVEHNQISLFKRAIPLYHSCLCFCLLTSPHPSPVAQEVLRAAPHHLPSTLCSSGWRRAGRGAGALPGCSPAEEHLSTEVADEWYESGHPGLSFGSLVPER